MRDIVYVKKVYEETYSSVYNYFFYLTLSREKTEDLTSETYLRMIEKIDLYDSRKAGIKVWLLTLARNIWIDEIRKERKWNWKTLEDWEEPESDYARKGIERAEAGVMIEKLLERLTQRERELIYLKYFMGLSYREIVAMTGLTEKNVSVILSRSLKKMREAG